MTRRLRSFPERISKSTRTDCAGWVNCGARAFPVRSVVTRGLPLSRSVSIMYLLTYDI
jgi:hypothetical protein